MIRLKRPSAVPSALRSGSATRKRAEKKISVILEDNRVPGAQDFTPVWRNEKVRDALVSMHRGRCCYCERLRDTPRESDIEHFRPKTEISDEDPSKPGYWWLAFEWDNLFLACKTCNESYKKTQFPIAGTRARGSGDSLEAEKALLLDAAADDPEAAIGFDFRTPDDVLAYGVGEEWQRGNTTIEVCGLNRSRLRRERNQTRQTLALLVLMMVHAQQNSVTTTIEKVGKRIREMTSSKSEVNFVGMRRAFFHTYDLGEFVKDD